MEEEGNAMELSFTPPDVAPSISPSNNQHGGSNRFCTAYVPWVLFLPLPLYTNESAAEERTAKRIKRHGQSSNELGSKKQKHKRSQQLSSCYSRKDNATSAVNHQPSSPSVPSSPPTNKQRGKIIRYPLPSSEPVEGHHPAPADKPESKPADEHLETEKASTSSLPSASMEGAETPSPSAPTSPPGPATGNEKRKKEGEKKEKTKLRREHQPEKSAQEQGTRLAAAASPVASAPFLEGETNEKGDKDKLVAAPSTGAEPPSAIIVAAPAIMSGNSPESSSLPATPPAATPVTAALDLPIAGKEEGKEAQDPDRQEVTPLVEEHQDEKPTPPPEDGLTPSTNSSLDSLPDSSLASPTDSTVAPPTDSTLAPPPDSSLAPLPASTALSIAPSSEEESKSDNTAISDMLPALAAAGGIAATAAAAPAAAATVAAVSTAPISNAELLPISLPILPPSAPPVPDVPETPSPDHHEEVQEQSNEEEEEKEDDEEEEQEECQLSSQSFLSEMDLFEGIQWEEEEQEGCQLSTQSLPSEMDLFEGIQWEEEEGAKAPPSIQQEGSSPAQVFSSEGATTLTPAEEGGATEVERVSNMLMEWQSSLEASLCLWCQ